MAGIEEGRTTLENIRRSLGYLLGTNLGEMVLMLGATLIGLPLPLLPLQLLWINLLGNGLPALGLGLLPPDQGIMERPPLRQDSLLNRDFYRDVFRSGAVSGLASLLAFSQSLSLGDVAKARTLALINVTGQQILYSFAHCPPGRMTRLMVLSALASAGLTGLVIAWPWARRVFHTAPPPLGELLPSLPWMVLPPLLEMEIRYRKKIKSGSATFCFKN